MATMSNSKENSEDAAIEQPNLSTGAIKKSQNWRLKKFKGDTNNSDNSTGFQKVANEKNNLLEYTQNKYWKKQSKSHKDEHAKNVPDRPIRLKRNSQNGSQKMDNSKEDKKESAAGKSHCPSGAVKKSQNWKLQKYKFDSKPNDGNSGFQRMGNEQTNFSKCSRDKYRKQKSQPNGVHTKNDSNKPIGLQFFLNVTRLQPEEAIMLLRKHHTEILKILQNELSDNHVVVITKILAIISRSKLPESKIAIFKDVIACNFFNRIFRYVTNLPYQNANDKSKNTYFWNDLNAFWKNLLTVFYALMDITLNSALELLPKITRAINGNMSLLETRHNVQVESHVKNNFENFENRIKLLEGNMTKTSIEVAKEPPNDFRLIPLYPTTAEIKNKGKIFLRENITEGPFESVDEYLDIHFRLLREDFVETLREGVGIYLENKKKSSHVKNHNVRVYEKCTILGTRDDKDEIGIVVSFQRILNKQELAKRFLYGGLVCLTDNNFKSIIFGRVIGRDEEDLSSGLVVVAFEENSAYALRTQYVMVECNVFFEPYYHILKALQQMTAETFPMQRYIIEVKTEIQRPKYLRRLREIKYNYVLNEAQDKAFNAAFKNEFVIVQGPPGTGKTFLGLRIIETLLKLTKSTILIVCYTNHALDQFLEGLVCFTEDIVRVGGQSQNPTIANFSINAKRKEWIGDYRRGENYDDNISVYLDLKFQLDQLSQKRKSWIEWLKKVDSKDCIVDFQEFRHIEPAFDNSWFDNASKEELEEWLLPSHFNKREIEIKFKSDTSKKEDDTKQHYKSVIDDYLKLYKHRSFGIFSLRKSNQLVWELQSLLNEPLEAEIRIPLQRRIDNLQKKNSLAEFYLITADTERIFDRQLNIDLNSPETMSLDERWELYFHWTELYKQHVNRQLARTKGQYDRMGKQYNEAKTMVDFDILKSSKIIGMTTTGAARLQTLLQCLQCKIVLVEEAAEVLEAHIISAVTSKCEHLILIGDHKQLRPSTANYYIETKMKLGISLFERMVLNNLQCSTLNVQHRMKPIIADLIRPTIYTDLQDHESVFNFEPVTGIDDSLYFIHHEEREKSMDDTSKQNKHEAKFLVRLANHLVLNGYEPEDITILSAYLGQKYMVDQEKNNYDTLCNVRSAVLDNYQGEENKIILLSLVRNNTENSIGFLKNENRVCVALSRAKHGLYIMGNIDLLCNNSTIWPKIKQSLEKHNSIGTSLKLRCAVHNEQETLVKHPNDFMKVLEGGCMLPCATELTCGHICASICHPHDRNHREYECREKCTKLLCADPLHKCRKLCYEYCGNCDYPVDRVLRCGHEQTLECSSNPETYLCPIFVDCQLPCGHETKEKPCHMKPESFVCRVPCEGTLQSCGHKCKLLCHVQRDPEHKEYNCCEPCERFKKGCTSDEKHRCDKMCSEECSPCEIQVKKRRSDCTHSYKVKCSDDVDEIVCKKNCRRMMTCGHFCKKKCNEPCGDCNVFVDKIIPECGHTLKMTCFSEPNISMCYGKCIKILNCGHRCQNLCNQECTNECPQLITCDVTSACGHTFDVPCYLRNAGDTSNLNYCNTPCRELFDCGHRCFGSCGICAQGRMHLSCQYQCDATLICGHKCTSLCRLPCQPCTKKCPFKCPHSKCAKLCGEPCTSCKEKCSRKCEHRKCLNRCGEKCSVPPCNEPCEKILKCGHLCCGYCGEPCPPFCVVCDEGEFSEISCCIGNEGNGRFVLLEDCGHVVSGMEIDGYVEKKTSFEGKGRIQVKVICCPKCETPIITTERYSDYVKDLLHDFSAIKNKIYGSDEDNGIKRQEIQMTIRELEEKSRNLGSAKLIFMKMLLRLKKKRGQFNGVLINDIICTLQFVERILQKLLEFPHEKWPEKLLFQVESLLDALNSNEHLNKSQKISLNMELQRLIRMSEYYSIELSEFFKSTQDVDDLHGKISVRIFSPKKFKDNVDEEVYLNLKRLNDICKTSVFVSQTKNNSAVTTINFKFGQWFKCPNGHYFTNEEKCSECNEDTQKTI